MSEILERIIIDDGICGGQPTIRGKRITVQTILEFLSVGDSIEEILEHYPSLNRDDIFACLHFASELMKHHYIIKSIGDN